MVSYEASAYLAHSQRCCWRLQLRLRLWQDFQCGVFSSLTHSSSHSQTFSIRAHSSLPGFSKDWRFPVGVSGYHPNGNRSILLFSRWESMCLIRASSGYPTGKPSWQRGQLRMSEPTVSIRSCGERGKSLLVPNPTHGPHIPACPILGPRAGRAAACRSLGTLSPALPTSSPLPAHLPPAQRQLPQPRA